jgi:hypothetical protein
MNTEYRSEKYKGQSRLNEPNILHLDPWCHDIPRTFPFRKLVLQSAAVHSQFLQPFSVKYPFCITITILDIIHCPVL